MKKILVLLAAALIFTSCQQTIEPSDTTDSNSETEPTEYICIVTNCSDKRILCSYVYDTESNENTYSDYIEPNTSSYKVPFPEDYTWYCIDITIQIDNKYIFLDTSTHKNVDVYYTDGNIIIKDHE